MPSRNPATQEKEKLKPGDLVTHVNSTLMKPPGEGHDGYEYGIVTHADTFLPYSDEVYRVWWIRKNRHHSSYLPDWQLKKLS